MWSEPARLLFCVYWVVMIAAVVVATPRLLAGGVPQIMVRKAFHIVATAMFLPVTALDAEFQAVAYAVATLALVLLELARWGRWPLVGPLLERYMRQFADHRDDDVLLTHLYLLLGCAIPLWATPVLQADAWASAGFVPDGALRMLPFAGVLTLGLGDAAAALVGHPCGRRRWPGLEKKSFEGSLASWVAMTLGTVLGEMTHLVAGNFEHRHGEGWPLSSGLLGLLAGTWQAWWPHVIGYTVCLAVVTLFEAYSTVMDNVSCPLVACWLWSVGSFAR